MLRKYFYMNWVSGFFSRACVIFLFVACLASPLVGFADEERVQGAKNSTLNKDDLENQQTADKDLARGYQAMERGDYEVAVDIFQGILSYDSNNYWACLNLGVIYHVHGRISEARRYYEKVVSNIGSAGKAFSASNSRFVSSSANEIAAYNLALLGKVKITVSERPVDLSSKRVFVVNFPFAEYRPSDNGYGQLLDALSFIKDGSKVLISGFTDWNGSQKYNSWLAIERAKFVDQWVKSKGLRVETVLSGSGLCCYVKSDNGQREAALSRRVEITVFAP